MPKKVMLLLKLKHVSMKNIFKVIESILQIVTKILNVRYNVQFLFSSIISHAKYISCLLLFVKSNAN